MSKSYRSKSAISAIKYSCIGVIKTKKWQILSAVIVSLIAIFAGVFVAIKYNNSSSLSSLQEISLDNFLSGFTGSSSAFFSRTFSLCINVLILSLCSLSAFLLPLAYVMFAYRGYLFGLNFALVFILYGFGGSLTALVVILPCQLLTLAALILFYNFFSYQFVCARKFGKAPTNRPLFLILAIIVFVLINLVETVFLYLLNGNVIMVI